MKSNPYFLPSGEIENILVVKNALHSFHIASKTDSISTFKLCENN